MPRILDRLFDLGPSDDPRRVAVGRRAAGLRRPIVSTPGARVLVTRQPGNRRGDVQKALLWLLRRGEPLELRVGMTGLALDGHPVSLAELQRLLK